MPCDTVTTQSINLAKASSSILVDALKEMGYNLSINQADRILAYTSGARIEWHAKRGLTVTDSGYGTQSRIEQITQAYSRQAVKWAAQRAGWTVQQTTQNQLTVTRR